MSSKPAVFAADLQLEAWNPEQHAPCVGLINPKSGGKMGEPILEVCHRTDYYKDRFFHIVQVVKGGEAFTNFRNMLCEVKDHAAKKNNPAFRPRLVVGGGDGTASFGLLVMFKALKADEASGDPRFTDKGRGFHWTDEELEKYFPALVQMPLGTGNDLGGVLGWGRKYPGYTSGGGVAAHGTKLRSWFHSAIHHTSRMVNFDVWGFMPPPGQEAMNIKLCELGKMEKKDGTTQCVMKAPDIVVPFLILLYGSFGFSGQVIAEFQLVRHDSQAENFKEYVKIIPSLMLSNPPPQLRSGMEGFSVVNGPGNDPNEKEKNNSDMYFPPRRTRQASNYGEVGFLNINSYGGGSLTGADRAHVMRRWCLCGSGRRPVIPSDGQLDFFRTRYARTNAKTGSKMQVDKKRNMTIKFEPSPDRVKGVFMQYDGEGRFVFHPEGREWQIDVHQALQVPFVLGPNATVKPSSDTIKFAICGDGEERLRIERRIDRWVRGELAKELNATTDDIRRAQLPLLENDSIAWPPHPAPPPPPPREPEPAPAAAEPVAPQASGGVSTDKEPSRDPDMDKAEEPQPTPPPKERDEQPAERPAAPKAEPLQVPADPSPPRAEIDSAIVVENGPAGKCDMCVVM